MKIQSWKYNYKYFYKWRIFVSKIILFFQVIGLTNADIGRTLGGVYDDSPSAESGYLAALGAVNTPTCSWKL